MVSPFLDRQHGTELCVIEQIERLSKLEDWTIELYSQRVEQLHGVCLAATPACERQGRVIWHKVSDIPGPHVLKYLWWFLANQWQRRRDRQSGRCRADLVYSPGINCTDADVIVVHIVFHALYERVRPQLGLRRAPLWSWPRLLHRKLYYRLMMLLERRIYGNPRVRLVAVSHLIAKKLEAYFRRSDVTVIPNAVDVGRFTPEACRARRRESRQNFHFAEKQFVVLLIGNDWKNKGLETLLRAAAQLGDLPLRLLVVGGDDRGLYAGLVRELGLEARIQFAEAAPDVLQFFAAADLYAGPSMEDSFGLPIAEALACGLPVIASVHAGASELIRDGENGLLLHQPTNASQLAALVRTVYENAALRQRLGETAERYARASCSWERNADDTRQFFERARAQRESPD